MVRATLERVLSADRLDLWYERTAEKQYTREVLFSTVHDLMSQVVFCVQPSVRAAYWAHEADVVWWMHTVPGTSCGVCDSHWIMRPAMEPPCSTS